MQNLLSGMQLLPINLSFGLPRRYGPGEPTREPMGAQPEDTSNRGQTGGSPAAADPAASILAALNGLVRFVQWKQCRKYTH